MALNAILHFRIEGSSKGFFLKFDFGLKTMEEMYLFTKIKAIELYLSMYIDQSSLYIDVESRNLRIQKGKSQFAYDESGPGYKI